MDTAINEPHISPPAATAGATFKHVLKVDAALFVGITFFAMLGIGITTIGSIVLTATGVICWLYWR